MRTSWTKAMTIAKLREELKQLNKELKQYQEAFRWRILKDAEDAATLRRAARAAANKFSAGQGPRPSTGWMAAWFKKINQFADAAPHGGFNCGVLPRR